MAPRLTRAGSRLANENNGLPRRDSAIVVGVTAGIVGLIVLWMSQAAAVADHPSAAVPEESAPPASLFVAGEAGEDR